MRVGVFVVIITTTTKRIACIESQTMESQAVVLLAKETLKNLEEALKIVEKVTRNHPAESNNGSYEIIKENIDKIREKISYYKTKTEVTKNINTTKLNKLVKRVINIKERALIRTVWILDYPPEIKADLYEKIDILFRTAEHSDEDFRVEIVQIVKVEKPSPESDRGYDSVGAAKPWKKFKLKPYEEPLYTRIKNGAIEKLRNNFILRLWQKDWFKTRGSAEELIRTKNGERYTVRRWILEDRDPEEIKYIISKEDLVQQNIWKEWKSRNEFIDVDSD